MEPVCASVYVCECVDAAGGKGDNAKEDHGPVQYVLSAGMLGYTVKLIFANTHTGGASLPECGFPPLNTQKHTHMYTNFFISILIFHSLSKTYPADHFPSSYVHRKINKTV